VVSPHCALVPRQARPARKTGWPPVGAYFQAANVVKREFSGWIGVYLDHAGRQKVDWDQIADLLEDAFCIARAENTHR